MLNKVSLGRGDIDKYRLVMPPETIDELVSLGKDLQGVRLCHINSTPFGGGVAELLVSYIPLMRALGIEADWQIIHGDKQFFTITKSLHNAIQGGTYEDIKKERILEIYRKNNQSNAAELDQNYDVFIVNDPQPAALRHYLPENKASWAWRCHVDSSNPYPPVWDFLKPYVEEHDAAIFTCPKFIPQDINMDVIVTMAPAINPFSSKNMFIKKYVCREMLDNIGVDRRRPLVTQVSRFDRWKDPFGTIKAYQIARKEIPGLQLALVGSFASDDPEGWDMYAALSEVAVKDDDIFIFSNLTGAGNMEVNAFQRASDIIVQKSIREGFGLVVTEALWKGTPVIAGNTGGIPMQMTGELSSLLVDTVEECAQKIVECLQDHTKCQHLGELGKENVRQNFLMPRLIKDELTLVKELLKQQK